MLRRLKKNGRKHFVKLLSTLAVPALLSCTSNKIPQPPTGQLYSVFTSANKLLCAEVPSGVKCTALPFEKADKYYCMSPDFWMKYENYVDELAALVKRMESSGTGSKPFAFSLAALMPTAQKSAPITVRLEDVTALKEQLWFMRKTLEWEREQMKR